MMMRRLRDPTHGQQKFALFNGYYDTWCYLPLIATVTFNTEPIQHVVTALLRPGTGAATVGVRGLLPPLRLRCHLRVGASAYTFCRSFFWASSS